MCSASPTTQGGQRVAATSVSKGDVITRLVMEKEDAASLPDSHENKMKSVFHKSAADSMGYPHPVTPTPPALTNTHTNRGIVKMQLEFLTGQINRSSLLLLF